MLELSTIITYPILILKSIGKKSFENMGRLIKRSGDTVFRLLCPAEVSFQQSQAIAGSIFAKKKTLYVGIDDTLLKKFYSKMMQGAGLFFDTKIGRRIMAFKLMIGVITDGKFTIPINCAFLFTEELINSMSQKPFTKNYFTMLFVENALKIFPIKTLIVVVDGLYSTIEFLTWCIHRNIRLEARMHSSRVVQYKGKKIKVKDLVKEKGLCPKGRQMARTIPIVWHDLDLELTIVKRFDKNSNESIVFQVATYKASPREHVAVYKKRWNIEMLNRTTKQDIGLQECFSRDLTTQRNHVAAVLLAYALMQLDTKIHRIDTPEESIRRCKLKNVAFLRSKFFRLLQDNLSFDA